MEYSPPQKSNAVFWLVIIIILLILVVTACFVFYFYKDKILKKPSVPPPKFTINIRSVSDHNLPINTSYKLLNGAQVVQEGTIYADRVEQFVDADNVTEYALQGFADGHYEGSTTCRYSQDCVLTLQKIGEYVTQVMPFADHQAVITKVVNGTFKGVVACVQMSWGVKDVILRNKDELEPVPSRLEPHCDKTYSVGDLAEDKYYVFEFTWVIEDEREKTVNIWLTDDGGSGCLHCAGDYKFGLNT